MTTVDKTEITRVLRTVSGGDPTAVNTLMEMVYGELRRIAGHYFKREAEGHTLQPTALVHEAYLQLVNVKDVEWKDRNHFFAIAAKTMRQILVRHAIRKKSIKRGGGLERVSLDEGLALSREKTVDILVMEEGLRELERRDPRSAQIVELRFYGGLEEADVAETMGLSRRTVQLEWRHTKAWLRNYLSEYRAA